MVNRPSASVVVPKDLSPLILTCAPGIGSPFSSLTTPLTEFCCPAFSIAGCEGAVLAHTGVEIAKSRETAMLLPPRY